MTCPICGGSGSISVVDGVPSIGGKIRCPPCHGGGRVTFFGWCVLVPFLLGALFGDLVQAVKSLVTTHRNTGEHK
jgi:hypothetical protein